LLKNVVLYLNLRKMKKIILVLALIFGFNSVSAQEDLITKHSGEVVKGRVVKLEEYTIVFKYEGEDAENTISKYAVEKIVYGKSGRLEEVTEKIIINGEEDWDKVVILEDKGYISGLKKGDEVRGKTGLVNFQTGNTGDKKAEKKLKMDAAKLGCQFILLTSDKTTVGANSNAIGGSQAIKKGVGYKY
jgi:sRNA-binding regulator protein Hfq